MEEQECGDDPKEGEEGKVYKRRRPPDKRKHHIDMEDITNLIHEKETLYKSLNAPKTGKNLKEKKSDLSMGNRDELLTRLRTFKSEKEKRMKRKQVIDAELKGLSQQLQKKTETCAKLQATLRYKDEQRTNDAIKRLETHLSTQQLKLCEEKKLVSEIDALKRSKKTLSDFSCAKQDVDQLRQKQRKLRDERDTLIRETHDIKAKENDVKVSLDALKTENKEEEGENAVPAHDKEALKKEIDSLYEKRRELRAVYKKELASFNEEQKEIERNVMKVKEQEKREEMRTSKSNTGRRRQKAREETEPYEDEMNICACLIQYLEPLKTHSTTEHEEAKPAGQAMYSSVSNTHQSALGENQDDSLIVKKKDNENLEGLFAVSNRKMGRKGSRKGRKSKDSHLSQKLVLHPHVFEQFFKLNVDPPSTYADVGRILEQLKDKKESYARSAHEMKQEMSLPSESDRTKTPKEPNPVPENVVSERDQSAYANAQRTCGTVGDKKEQDEVGLMSAAAPPNDPSKEGQGREVSESCSDQQSTRINETSGLSRTSKDNCGNVGGENASEEERFPSDDKQSNSMDEKPSKIQDQTTDSNQTITEDEFIRNKENSKESINESCVMCPTVITDTLEKGIDSLGVKESAKEIEVRAT